MTKRLTAKDGATYVAGPVSTPAEIPGCYWMDASCPYRDLLDRADGGLGLVVHNCATDHPDEPTIVEGDKR
jgi:hypothetical protein